MTSAHRNDLDVLKDIPGYKAIMKAVLKSQIQMLVEQLSDQTGEESVLITASISDGTLSHLGSESGKFFLENHDEIKSQFLGFCLKRHHKRKVQEMLNIPQAKRFAGGMHHSGVDLPRHSVESDMTYSPNREQSLSIPSVHPVGIKIKSKQTAKASKLLQSQNDLDHRPVTGIDMSLKATGGTDYIKTSLTETSQIKIETESDMFQEMTDNSNNTQKDEGISENTNRAPVETAENEILIVQPNVSVKVEVEEEEEDLEITGVELGEEDNQMSAFGQSASNSQSYMQNIYATENQESNMENQQHNGEEQCRWTDESSLMFHDPVTDLYACGICKYKSPVKTNVRRHTRIHQSNKSDRPVCKVCKLSFIDNYKLKKHTEVDHMGIRYMCEKCGRKFKSPYYLATHRRHKRCIVKE